MVSKRLRARVQAGGSLVLDAQGLSLLLDGAPGMRAKVAVAERDGCRVLCSALTPLEIRGNSNAARLSYVQSHIQVEQVTDDVVRKACELLDISGLDGHECLVDAIVTATAALAKPPVLVVTSDRSHIPELCKAADELPGAPVLKAVFV